jgi:hypothetical protein
VNKTFSAALSAATTRSAATQQRVPGRFFSAMSWLLLAIVVAGFSPTLYLRAWTDAAPISAHVMIHGIVMTAWFVLFATQTSLVAAGRTRVHRRLGIAAAAIGVLVIVMALATTLGFGARIIGRGHELPPAAFAGLSSLIWGNFAVLLVVTGLLAAAIAARHRPEAHKRLMTIASIGLIAPALARIVRWPIFGGDAGALVPVVLLALLASVVVYDVVSSRRIHPATITGVTSFVLVTFSTRAFGFSESGQSLLRALL